MATILSSGMNKVKRVLCDFWNSFHPVKPWDIPIELEPGATPIKFVICNPFYYFNHQAFISDEAYYNYWSWFPKSAKQRQGINYPLFYSSSYWYHDLYPNASTAYKRREIYTKIYKYKTTNSIFNKSELFCTVYRSQMKEYFFHELEFKDQKVCLFQHKDWPVLDFRIGDKQYRWLYFYIPLNPLGSYVYSLFEAQEGETTLADFINPESGVVWRNDVKENINQNPGFMHSHDRFRMKKKIGEFTYSTFPPIIPTLSHQKTAKFHTFQQEPVTTNDSISDTNQKILCTTFLLKLHEEYHWMPDVVDDYRPHKRGVYPLPSRIGANHIRP